MNIFTQILYTGFNLSFLYYYYDPHGIYFDMKDEERIWLYYYFFPKWVATFSHNHFPSD